MIGERREARKRWTYKAVWYSFAVMPITGMGMGMCSKSIGMLAFAMSAVWVVEFASSPQIFGGLLLLLC